MIHFTFRDYNTRSGSIIIKNFKTWWVECTRARVTENQRQKNLFFKVRLFLSLMCSDFK